MQTLEKFKKFVDEITSTKSKLTKANILLTYKNDEDIKYYLNFLLNPYITTGISDKKINKDFGIKPYSHRVNQYGLSKINIKNMLNYLSKHNTGTDEIIRTIQMALENIRYFSDNATVELCKKIITKNLPLGINIKTINKVMPGLIPEFKLILANDK